MRVCESVDAEKSGYLDANTFYSSWEKIGAKVSYVLRKYLELLFYTDKEELDVVPYKNFIQVYT